MRSSNLLDNLLPNILPSPIGLWPWAYGWWILLCLLCLTVGLISFFICKKIKKSAYRRAGIIQMKRAYQVYKKHQDTLLYIHQCNRLLKRVALQAYPTEKIAPLSGERWLRFLSATLKSNKFDAVTAQALGDMRFQAGKQTVIIEKLHLLAIMWIKKHYV